MVQSGSEGVRGSRQGLRESRWFSWGLMESEGPVDVRSTSQSLKKSDGSLGI